MNELHERSFQPLEIFELTGREKNLLIEALRLGKQHGIIVQARLERELGGSLRYILNSDQIGLGAEHVEGKRQPVPVAYGKWVYLYDYVMNDLFEAAMKSGIDALREKIEELHDQGLKTGRYDNDLHLFNSRYLNQNTRASGFDNRSLGHYVGFRLRSNGVELITCLMQIYSSEKGGRRVFHSKLAESHDDREVRGTVYELAGHLYLLGFLNDGHGGEYYALCPDGRSHDVLYGIMATVNHARTPHAKQCCFVRAQRIEQLDFDPVALVSPKDWSNMQDQLEFKFGGSNLDIPIRLKGPTGLLNLRSYISDDMVFSRHEHQKPHFSGPPG
ncbi:hypothetical protein PMI42_00163 [Bradyrhizobium sp. YR681]|uniref:hypothetical protein n=1 Tax=Bradyrhizobium sp. YR681 TaxID=1144344 RepID=UPI000270F578|nr:hypothetical protein [Bradyrhizobium sp. YR681]EJN16262.1 hypothetical protein PMI42_00163 [Bradyrhizobium sp. YR681]